MKYILPELPYELDALQPHIDKRTLEFHHGKHHQAYVNNLNNLVPESSFAGASLVELIKESDGGIFNNAAQVWNHTFYFDSFSPKGGGDPSGDIAKLLEKSFGSFDLFKEKFSKAAASLFGSGWAWVVLKDNGLLEIVQESNAGNPIRNGLKPIITIDVWEHAYYLDYQNRRPDYISAFWNVLDWQKVSSRL